MHGEDSARICNTLSCWIDLHIIFWAKNAKGYCIAGVAVTTMVSPEAPVTVKKGDLYTLVLQMLSQQAGRAIPSGRLVVTWQRSG